MILKDFHSLVDKWTKKIKDISTKKGQDYASKEDTLLNFKNTCKLCKLLNIDVRESPEEVARFYIITKELRLANLKGRDPANESVEDSELDRLTYIFLGLGCKEDKEGGENDKTNKK